MFLVLEFDSEVPIYLQIRNKIVEGIANGELIDGQKLPSVRDLASEATVNPNTMQKALAELERRGLVYSVRTSGRFITQDCNIIKDTQTTLAKDEIKEFLEKMQKIGFDKNRLLTTLKEVIKEME